MLNTLTEARAPSTRRLYAQKWSIFSDWCTTKDLNPNTCEVEHILSFLQEMLDSGRAPSTLKVYVAAITANHALIAGRTVGKHDLIIKFLRGARRLNPPRPNTVPSWDLSTVLKALRGPPFEPLEQADLRALSFKTALLLALASVKRVGDLHAFSIDPSCLEFGPNDSKVILRPRAGYIPKVLTTPFRVQVVSLLALPTADGEQTPNTLCPVRALRIYTDRSASYRKSDQLFVSFAQHSLGMPLTKQRLSKWIVEAIALAYASLNEHCPVGLKAHSTRGMASSWAWSTGISIVDICNAAGWSSPSTFVRFYSLDVPALQAQVLSA